MIADRWTRVTIAPETMQLHVAMLHDRARTEAYLDAVRRAVRPGDVVLDIGTGTGIYAMAAAQAGASHVYAIEAGRIAGAAQALFDANGLADRITLVEGWSTDIALPERADVLVAELIGDEPLAESVIPITRDAIHRLLKPGARLVPSRIKVFCAPLTIPSADLTKFAFVPDTLERWGAWYDLNFGPLADVGCGYMFGHVVNAYEMRNWKMLADPLCVIDVNFNDWQPLRTHVRRKATTLCSGELNGLSLFFELYAGEACFYSTEPSVVHESNHWMSPVHVLRVPVHVDSGDDIEVSYWYRRYAGRSGCAVRSAQ